MGTCHEYHNNVTVCECDDGVTGDNCEIEKQCNLDCGDYGNCESLFGHGRGFSLEIDSQELLRKKRTTLILNIVGVMKDGRVISANSKFVSIIVSMVNA